MNFEEKVTFLRTLPQFKVVPISEVRAIAFAVCETAKARPGEVELGKSGTISLAISLKDIEKIVRVYPDLKDKLTSK